MLDESAQRALVLALVGVSNPGLIRWASMGVLFVADQYRINANTASDASSQGLLARRLKVCFGQ